MQVFLCVDEHLGMMFNKRRQSRDRILIDDMVKSMNGTIYINEFSKKMFDELNVKYKLFDDFTDIEKNCSCFIENKHLSDYQHIISKIVLYKWNRHYPADFYFDIDLSKSNFKLESVAEFKGSSHEKITKEIWLNE